MSTKVRVNLREMYPKYYNQDCFVEVDQDVYETMNKYDHIDAVYKRKVDYHKGYFSLDRSPFLELEKEGFDVNENILLKELIHQELISFIELTIKDLPVKEKERILKNMFNVRLQNQLLLKKTVVYLRFTILLKQHMKKLKKF